MTSSNVLSAAVYAAQMHKDQRRKGESKAPYINHVLAVAGMVADAGGDDAVVIAALLHDVVEDTDATHDDVLERFGEEVSKIVQEVSDDKDLPKADRKRLQVEHASHKSKKAKMIKLADKTHNLQDLLDDPPPDWHIERIREYFAWAKQVVDGLRGDHPELEENFDAVHAQGVQSFGT